MKKKVIIFIIIFVLILLLGFTIGSILTYFMKNGLKAKFNFIDIIPYYLNKTSLLIGIVVFIALGGYMFYLLMKYNYFNSNKLLNKIERADSDEYGSADFMTKNEMKGYYGNKEKQIKNRKGDIINGEDYSFSNLANTDFEGYVIKSYKDRRNQVYLEGIDHEHCLVIGTNGSGKSTKFLIPTILANANSKNKPSMLFNDLKGELFEKTSKYLKDNGYNIICVNLRTPRKSTRFNPMDMIYDLYQEYQKTGNGDIADKVAQYILEIVATLVDEGEGANKEFNLGARGILTGIIYGMLEDSAIPEYNMTKEKFTFQQISNIINKQRDLLMSFLTNRPKTSKVWDYASMIIGNDSEKTVASYISTLQTNLTPFLEEGISYITSASDFDLSKIVKEPTAIFMIIPDESAGRYKIAIAMVVQFYNYLTYQSTLREDLRLERTWYFLLDEFGNMPKIPNFAKYISTSRGRNIFFCPIVQATSQFETIFSKSEAQTIQDQCHAKVLIGSNEQATLEYFQKELGTYTINTRSANMNEHTIGTMEYSGTTSHGKKNLVEIEDLRYKNFENQNTIYFTNYGKKPCKSQILPSFDKDTFAKLLGSIKNDITEKKLEFQFYDLQNRENAFIDISSGKIDKSVGSLKKDNELKINDETGEIIEEEDDELIDITDDFNSSEDNDMNDISSDYLEDEEEEEKDVITSLEGI